MNQTFVAAVPGPRVRSVAVLLRALPWLAAFAVPLVVDNTTSGNLAYCLLWAFGAIGLAVMWGFGGILSFGQTAFFGIAGYTYGVVTLNLGDGWLSSWAGLAGGLLLCVVAAALLGYMIFYGKIRGVFIGIVTLSVTLVLETFMAQTAGPQWTIGEARLNGFNGMSGMPPLSVSWFGGAEVQAGFAYLAAWFLLLAATRPVIELQRMRARHMAPSSDADQLAHLTGVPGLAWVTLFGATALVALLAGGALLFPDVSLHLPGR